jgi:dipeptidyl aminopeptidase/acylaminoacyl peptidase
MDLATRRTLVRQPVTGDTTLRDVEWSDDRTLLVTVSVVQEVGRNPPRRYEFRRTLAVNVDTGKPTVLRVDPSIGVNIDADLLAARTGRPGTVVMSLWDSVGLSLASRVFDVDTATGKGTPVATGAPETVDWAVDAAGRVVARVDRDTARARAQHDFVVNAARDGRWIEIFRVADPDRQMHLAHLTPGGREIVVFGNLPGERNKLRAIALDGSGVRVLFEEPDRDLEGWLIDGHDRTVVGASLGGLDQPNRWLDTEAEAYHGRVERAFPGRRVAVYGRSADRRRALAYVHGPAHPPIYYLVDFEARTADTIGEAFPALVGANLGRVEASTYPARDGTPIPAYVTYPPGLEPKGLPLVVLPHRGPDRRDDATFHWLAQFLATRGYLVLQPQFRGSRGFGQAFRAAGKRQWGALVQDDVTDGVRTLVERGAADAQRVCIVGLGWGGYVALAGATLTPELYACAASVNGVTDLPELLGAMKVKHGPDSVFFRRWSEEVGQPTDRALAARSPARRVQDLRAPVLLIHGEQDTFVPIAQSEKMARAMSAAGKPFEFVRLPGEDHDLSRSPSRIRVLEELEPFLAKHLAPRANAP